MFGAVGQARYVEDRWAVEGEHSHCYVVGLDLGKMRDYTALVLNEVFIGTSKRYRRTEFERTASVVAEKRFIRHSLVNLFRYELGTTYPAIYSSVQAVMGQLPARDMPPQLVVDQTGVGGPVVDGLRDIGLRPIGVTITGGISVNRISHSTLTVPKSLLASALDAALGQDRLDIADSALASQQFRSELGAFRVKIRSSGTESYEADRERDHDDLVMAAALAVWHGENLPRPMRSVYVPMVRG